MPNSALGPWDRPTPSRYALQRDGVIELLDRGAEDPLTIVRAPAGAGKTTTLLQWIEHQQVSDVIWVNALRIAGDTREQRATALWEYLRALPTLPGSGRRTIIIDDAMRGLGEYLDPLIVESARMPGGPRWMLLTRVLSRIEEHRGINNLDTTLLGPEDLQLSADECASYLAGSSLAEHQLEISELTGRSAWLLRTAKDFALKDTGEPETLLERTLQVVLRDAMLRVDDCELGEAEEELLLRLSLLPAFGPAAAAYLNVGADAEGLLTVLEEAGLSVRTCGGLGEAYEFVHAIREGLRRRHQALPVQTRRVAEALAARFALEHDDSATALELSVRAGDYDLCSRVLLRDADAILHGSLGAVAMRWLPLVPLGEMAKYPLLAGALGLLYNVAGIHRLRSRELLILAAADVPTTEQPCADDEFLMDAVRSIALRVGGIGDRGRRSAQLALQRYEKMEPRERDGIGGAEELLLAQLGVSLHLAGLRDLAHTAAALASSAAQQREQVAGHHGYSTAFVGYLHAFEGDMAAASAALQGLKAGFWEHPTAPAYLTSPYRLARAIIALEQAHWDEARRYLDLLRDQLATSEFWPVMRYSSGILAIVSGNAASYQAQLELALSRETELPPIGAVGEAFTSAALAWLHLANGDQHRALEALDGAGDSTEVSLLRARIELARNRPDSALILLDRCVVITPRERLNSAILRLAAQLSLGHTKPARTQLEVVLGLSAASGLRLGLLTLPEPDLRRVREFYTISGADPGLAPDYRSPIPGDLASVRLTEREQAILHELVSQGNAAMIAERQFVSVNTVKSQLRSIYRKLGVTGRAAALDRARHHGLI